MIVLIAERDGEAAGYVSALRRPHLWSGDDILALDDRYVRERHRDGGVGRALMLDLARLALPQRLTIAAPEAHRQLKPDGRLIGACEPPTDALEG